MMKGDRKHENVGQRGRSVYANGSKSGLGDENRCRTGQFHRKTRFWHCEMACKSGRSEDNHENGPKQFIYAMNNKSNGKSRMNAEWMPIQRNGNGGFTLVELLTVIVIVGILASLILPALSKAKAQGQSTVCKNNLSQIGRAMEMYLSDNNRYPSAIFGGGHHQFKTWADQLAPYNPLNWTNLSWNCPTYIANNDVVKFAPPPKSGGQVVEWISYSYNAFGIAGPIPNAGGGWPTSQLGLGLIPPDTSREQLVLAPGEMYVAADARPIWWPPAGGCGYIGQPWMCPYRFGPLSPDVASRLEQAPPHSQGYNILFSDTHVALVKRQDYLYPPRTARNWNRDNQPHPELWASTNDWAIQN
jgi:prepilin-type N-terminal cleavage/methylation domain-containing protein/prepilin-type processing-associated H-X9-DG protein